MDRIAPRTDPARVITAAVESGLSIATAESLTAGALVARLVDVPGSSAAVAGGAACYSYQAKTRVLGVDAGLLEREGAVSSEVARQMAAGARALYAADVAIATTGVAGPGPDERAVPAGTVFLAVDRGDADPVVEELHLPGDRAAVRTATVDAALTLLLHCLTGR